MRKNPIRGCRVLIMAGAFASAGCATSGLLANDVQASNRRQAKLSDFTLGYDLPSLKPSKDFPPPKIVDYLDLGPVTESRFVLHGYWDGPRHELLSVTGTLHIWLDVRPWPAEAAALQGCDAKARVFVQKKFDSENGFYDRGYIKKKPVQEILDFSVRGAAGLEFRSSFRRNSVAYVIPLDGDHMLYLVLESVANSDPSKGWPALSAAEQDKFLRSLELTGPIADCQ